MRTRRGGQPERETGMESKHTPGPCAIPVAGHSNVIEVGYERGAYYWKARNGAKHCTGTPPGKRNDHASARERFRYALRNEADMRGGADAYLTRLDGGAS